MSPPTLPTEKIEGKDKKVECRTRVKDKRFGNAKLSWAGCQKKKRKNRKKRRHKSSGSCWAPQTFWLKDKWELDSQLARLLAKDDKDIINTWPCCNLCKLRAASWACELNAKSRESENREPSVRERKSGIRKWSVKQLPLARNAEYVGFPRTSSIFFSFSPFQLVCKWI